MGVLAESLSRAEAAGIRLLLENHSDFTVSEYRSIVEELGRERVGVFLDLINPIAALEDPLPVVEELAPLAAAGHVKDYVFRSIQTDDAYHRRGFEVLYRYPGEGVAPLEALVRALRVGVAERTFFLTVEGLDNRGGYDLRPVFCADTEERGGDREPVFRAVAGYTPGPRLSRKLELEGIRWIS